MMYIRQLIFCISLTICSLSSSANLQWTFLDHPDFINMSPGVDGLWGTSDDLDLGTGPGANPLGNSTYWDTTEAFGNVSFVTGVNTTTGPIPAGTGILEQINSTGEFRVLGSPGVGVTAPLDLSKTSTWTINADQSVVFDTFYPGDSKLAGDGYIFTPGQTANGLLGPSALANHIDYMLSRIASPYDAVIYFDMTFTDLVGAPIGLGTVNGVFIASPVPVPGAVWMLMSAIGFLGLKRRDANGKVSC